MTGLALDWKWLFIYPAAAYRHRYFVQFPRQTPVNFEITADAVIRSGFLAGRADLRRAMSTQLHLLANANGDFRGSSANISGEGFRASMAH